VYNGRQYKCLRGISFLHPQGRRGTSALKLEAAGSSEKLVAICQTARYHIQVTAVRTSDLTI
jgi:hypothetical protein